MQNAIWELCDDWQIKDYGLSTDYTYLPVDFANNGRMGFVKKNYSGMSTEGVVMKSDGMYDTDRFDILTWNEYYNLRGELKLSSGGEGVPGWDDMFGRDGGGTAPNDFSVLDINGDGLPDMVDGAKGIYYLNTGLGGYVYNSFGGRTEMRDLNGDGLCDMVVYNRQEKTVSVMMTRPGETSIPEVLLRGYKCADRIWCYDFDNDGDVDILVPINSTSNTSFLVFYSNDGKGGFTQSDNWVEGNLTFHDCLDIDADGVYEILAECNDSGTKELRAYKIPGPNISDKYTVVYNQLGTPVNIDNSGVTYLAVNSSKAEFIKFSDNINQRPSAPGKPTFVFMPETNLLKVNWSAATDKETPQADLTYEIRVGTAPGLDDVVAANALPDGRRRNIMQGANGHLRYRTFDVSSWPVGKYYISVQAVDPNMLGSTFSEYAVFDKKVCGARFSIDAPATPGAGDLIRVRLDGVAVPSVTYTWDFGGAEIVEQSADLAICTIRYHVGGDKTISLTATARDGSVGVPVSRQIHILPASVGSDDSYYNLTGVFDLDADGSEEYYDNGKKFYEQDSEGNITAIRKLYNSGLPDMFGYFTAVDVNRDGLLDIFNHTDGYTGRGRVITNNGNKNLTFGEELSLYRSYQFHEMIYCDFDNDGCLEMVHTAGDVYLKFSDDMTQCSKHQLNVKEYFKERDRIKSIYDFNGDGLMDIHVGSTVDDHYICYNNGDMTFSKGEVLQRNKDGVAPTLIGDFDGDGKYDILYNGYVYGFGVSTYKEYIEIAYGNGHTVDIQCPDGTPFGESGQTFDFDNNGCMDFVTRVNDGNNGLVVIFTYPDNTYTIESCNISFTDDKSASRPDVIYHSHAGYVCQGANRIDNVANTRPSAPAGLRAGVDGAFVNIEWNPASDAETPQKALRYNISLRYKDKEGAGAYILSPMNFGRDGVSVPSGHRLLTAPRIKVPISSLPAGEYEVKVQTVDGMAVTGNFSQPYCFTVSEHAMIEAPMSAMVSTPVRVKVSGNVANPILDFGADAHLSEVETGVYDVSWDSEGVKDLMVNGTKYASLYVHPYPDADFMLPEDILAGATVNIDCNTASSGNWVLEDESGQAVGLDMSDLVKNVAVTDTTVTFTLMGDKGFTLRHVISESYGSVAAEHECVIAGDNAVPAIASVDIDEVTNSYAISWDVGAVPSQVTGVEIYRETSRINVYEKIGDAPISSGVFIDQRSNPAVKAERYRMSWVLPYGISALSEAHQPMHLQLNQGLNGAVNLMWSKYEGREVESYVILGGDTPQTLEVEAAVSGHVTSYSAVSPKGYYAVGIRLSDAMKASASRSYASDKGLILSNVAMTSEASQPVLATAISIAPTGGKAEIDIAKSVNLQLRSVLVPAGVTFADVDWCVTRGETLASISEDGMVTAFDTGGITVTATTRDGSGLSASIDIEIVNVGVPLTYFAFSKWPTGHKLEVGQTFRYEIKDVKPADATELPYWEVSNPEVASVTQDGLVTALAPGQTDIYVRSRMNPELFISLGLHVEGPVVKVERIEITPDEIVAMPGSEVHIEAKIYPENATDKRLVWEVYPYKSQVARVTSNGLVTIMADGEATVLVYSADDSSIVAMARVIGSSGIDAVFADEKCHDVYNINGVLLLHDASIDDLGRLPAGVYIIGGRKILLAK